MRQSPSVNVASIVLALCAKRFYRACGVDTIECIQCTCWVVVVGPSSRKSSWSPALQMMSHSDITDVCMNVRISDAKWSCLKLHTGGWCGRQGRGGRCGVCTDRCRSGKIVVAFVEHSIINSHPFVLYIICDSDVLLAVWPVSVRLSHSSVCR